MNLVKTSVPGFSKNKDTNVIVNTDKARMEQVQAERLKLKLERLRARQIEDLEKRIKRLEKIVLNG